MFHRITNEILIFFFFKLTIIQTYQVTVCSCVFFKEQNFVPQKFEIKNEGADREVYETNCQDIDITGHGKSILVATVMISWRPSAYC